MKTSSRRRVLISSVAMLLVAMLALGTATFAWFTQNTTATADGLYAKTVKASSLEISKADKAWATSITYSQGNSSTAQTMFPASSATGTTWYTATSEDAATGTAVAGTIQTVQPAGTNAKYVYKEMLNIKNSGTEGTITNIEIAIKYPSAVSDYVRVALVPTNEEGTTNADFASYVYDTEGDTYNALNGTTLTDVTSVTAKTTTTISVADLGAGEATYYNLYVWFEGQDEDCIDANAGQTLAGLSFEVTGEPA